MIAPFLFEPSDTTIVKGQSRTLTIRGNPEYSTPPPTVRSINTVNLSRQSVVMSSMNKPNWKIVLTVVAAGRSFPCRGFVEMMTDIPDLPQYDWICEEIEPVR